MKTGTITNISGSWGSWLISLSIKDAETGKTTTVYGDNGPVVRALDAIFGCITPGHCVDASAVIGREINYEVDDLGLLAGLEAA